LISWIRWLKRSALVLVVGALFLLFGAGYYFVRESVVDDRRIPFPRATDPTLSSAGAARIGRILLTAPGGVLLKNNVMGEDTAGLLQDHPETNFEWDTARPGVARVTLGDGPGRTRLNSLAGAVGSVFEWRGVVPAGAWFQSRIGMVTKGTDVRFSVDLEELSSGEINRVFSETLSAPRHAHAHKNQGFLARMKVLVQGAEQEDEQWRALRVDLSDWGGRSVSVRLITAPVDPAVSDKSGLGMWGTPEIRSPQPKPVAARARKTPLDLPVLLTVFESTPEGLLFSSQPGRSRLSGFLGESVSFPFFYTADVRSNESMEQLIFLSTGAWPDAVGRLGYRTRAVGAFSDNMMAMLDRAGFDEIHWIPHDGYDTVRAAGRAAAWVQDSSSSAELVFLYLADTPRGRWAPARYWARSFSVKAADWARWKRTGEDAYRDDYFGRVVDTVDQKETEWIAGAVSLSGRASLPMPIVYGQSGRRKTRVIGEAGWSMREREIRVVFGLRSLQRWAPHLCRSPGQIPDVGPTLLGSLQIPFAAGRGRVWVPEKAESSSDSSGAWVIRSARAKAVVVDGRYKYIRHGPNRPVATAWRGDGQGAWTDFPAEEMFDLWTDPGESKNLAQERRNVLARLRDVLDELDPDPAEIRLSFLNPAGQRVDGMVNCVQGQLGEVSSSVGGRRLGAYEFAFSTTAVSGDIRFRTWPPLVPFRLRVLFNGKLVDTSRIQVGRWGVPLFEIKGDEWFDKTKFGWLDGWAPPRPSTETVVSLGRVSPALSEEENP
jgi:hypothetical protein